MQTEAGAPTGLSLPMKGFVLSLVDFVSLDALISALSNSYR
jgi:hypothetical protein